MTSVVEPTANALDVLRLRASKHNQDDPTDVQWEVAYDTHAPLGGDRGRVVFGTLKVDAPRGWADIMVLSVFYNTDELDGDELAKTIRDADATEALFDFARSHLAPLLATVGADSDIPRKAPDALLEAFDSSSDPEEQPAEEPPAEEGASA